VDGLRRLGVSEDQNLGMTFLALDIDATPLKLGLKRAIS
jgi:hypothetical protein